jgi:hypothetical protein
MGSENISGLNVRDQAEVYIAAAAGRVFAATLRRTTTPCTVGPGYPIAVNLRVISAIKPGLTDMEEGSRGCAAW